MAVMAARIRLVSFMSIGFIHLLQGCWVVVGFLQPESYLTRPGKGSGEAAACRVAECSGPASGHWRASH